MTLGGGRGLSRNQGRKGASGKATGLEAAPAYERLSPEDRSFLDFEDPHTPMHHGGVGIFEAGPLRMSDGGIDVERIRVHVAGRLHCVPRYRQRLAHVPIENAPVWVDDEHFNLPYHVRYAVLPRPGNDDLLKQEWARIMSQQLDHGKPLWELWIVDGLEGDRFAMVLKIHHSVGDGVAAVGFLSALLSPAAETAVEADGHPSLQWVPRPAPSAGQLLQDAIWHRVRSPIVLARELGAGLLAPWQTVPTLVDNIRAVARLINVGLRRPADTPLNGRIGSHRRLEWLSVDLDEVRQIKSRFSVTLNDVALATVTGGVRRFLRQRRVSVKGLDLRVVNPVNVRPEDLGSLAGNRVSAWLTSLPIQERHPVRRLAQIKENTAQLKASNDAVGLDAVGRVAAEMVAPSVVTAAVRFAAMMHPYNLLVTNIPGPPIPLYLLGARMLHAYPVVPLFENQGLAVAMFSYDGQLCWGFNADFNLVPDLHAFVDAVRASFDELRSAAGLTDVPHPVATASTDGRDGTHGAGEHPQGEPETAPVPSTDALRIRPPAMPAGPTATNLQQPPEPPRPRYVPR